MYPPHFLPLQSRRGRKVTSDLGSFRRLVTQWERGGGGRAEIREKVSFFPPPSPFAAKFSMCNQTLSSSAAALRSKVPKVAA